MRKSYLKSRLPDFFKHDMTHTIQLKTLLTLTWRHHIHDDPDEGSPVSFCFSISCIPQVSCISFYWTEKYHKSLNFTFYNFSKLSQSHSLILLLDFLLTLFYIWNRIKIENRHTHLCCLQRVINIQQPAALCTLYICDAL